MKSRRKSASDTFATLAAAAVIAAASIALEGCNTSGCTDNRNSLPLAGFYSMGEGTAIRIDSIAIGGVGAPSDTLLNNPQQSVESVYLPFRSTATTTSFYFRYLQKQLAAFGMADTITFDYTSEPMLVSEECGVMYVYHITGMSHTSFLIDSVAITDSTITNLDIERVKIYFRTEEP